MYDSINIVKNKLRKDCRCLRSGLNEKSRASFSEAICSLIENWEIFKKSQAILVYAPIKDEVNLLPLLDRNPEKKWMLPRIIEGQDRSMVFHPYDPDQLVVHPFGMAEPASSQPVIPSEEVEIALVPGLAFDLCGWRLGYGGGYFDAFLGNFTGVSVGITYNKLLMDKLPRGPFDFPVHWIVTEEGIMKAAQEYNRPTYVQSDIS